ncbi:hypothetical protein OFC10_31120, partial [Escherichia coli]|nr:hypothetical protein [Escherichia coli]
LKEETYPSGRVVKNQLDPSGDLLTVTSKKTAGGQFFQYAGSAQYNPAGALTSLQLGNGLYESTEFNARLQPTKIQVGATSGQYDRLKIE